ncbi:MAG: lactate utilization protein C [Oceanospirillales bacterium]|uniref:L-lactate dehydrogenase complex protein LldG n=1 Tax=Marinobacterium halophilum TaxID=267374 RepID=A0A2P8F3J5_9GAMM|nr:lactate utilization protein C [Marinobacterium halophilum]MBR9827847.1 lactate utilization protein C [Oceanospirillales bacterium]PSL16281.1 L-lactate dehydrogenase complex protein LldG [Marinobacterium halophilum]
MNSRADIFANIRRGLRRSQPTEAQQEAVRQRLQQHPRNLIPSRSQHEHEALVELFVRMAQEASAEVVELDALELLPEAVAKNLEEKGQNELIMASDAALTSLGWAAVHERIECHQRAGQVGDEASLTMALAGIAETGTLMLYSRPDSPTTLNFLPDTHLVVLRKQDIVGPYEDAWDRLRTLSPGRLPRTVNLITGPSRSADIEQKLQMGAHGPRQLVIFLLP